MTLPPFSEVLDAAGTVGFSVVLPAIVGGLLHELTHAAAVVLLGHDLRGMNLHRLLVGVRRGSTVVYEARHESRWNTLIGLSPAAIGALAAAGWWLTGQQLSGTSGVALAVGWAFYTLNVSREDVLGGDVEAAPNLDKALHFAFIGGVGLALALVDYYPAEMLGQALVLAGFVGGAYNLFKADRAGEVGVAQ